MKPLFLMATASPGLPDVDVHFLLMTGLVFITGLGTAVSILLLLLLAPILHLVLGAKTTKKAAANESASRD